MTLEEEKKLVAEKLMGWRLSDIANEASGIPAYEYVWEEYITSSKTWEFIYFYGDWRPNEDRNFWDEIWGKMDVNFYYQYKKNLSEIISKEKNLDRIMDLHTAKPDICWKALIKVLTYSNGYILKGFNKKP